MADWNEAEDWADVPEYAAALAEFIVAPEGEKIYETRAEIARAFGVSAKTLYRCSKTQQFQRYLADCQGIAGLSRDDRVEKAKRILWDKATKDGGDTKALGEFLRMEGEFAPEKHEVTHIDVREMTTDAIEEELQRILDKEKA